MRPAGGPSPRSPRCDAASGVAVCPSVDSQVAPRLQLGPMGCDLAVDLIVDESSGGTVQRSPQGHLRERGDLGGLDDGGREGQPIPQLSRHPVTGIPNRRSHCLHNCRLDLSVLVGARGLWGPLCVSVPSLCMTQQEDTREPVSRGS